MSEAYALLRLQEVDLELEEKAQALAAVEAQLGETEQLVQARQRVLSLREQIREKRSALHDAEWDVQDIENDIANLEKKLYGGSVRSPKELTSMQRELDLHKANRDKGEDRELALMEETEKLEGRLAAEEAVLAKIETTWREAQQRLTEERQTLNSRLVELREARQAQSAAIGADRLRMYEELRRTKRGRAVSSIERNTCQWCRVSLPMNIVQQARTSRELVFCSSCNRILYAQR